MDSTIFLICLIFAQDDDGPSKGPNGGTMLLSGTVKLSIVIDKANSHVKLGIYRLT